MVEENGKTPHNKSPPEIEMAGNSHPAEIQMVQESGHPPPPESKNLPPEIRDVNEEMPPRPTVDKGKTPMKYNDDDVEMEESMYDYDSSEEDEQLTGDLFLGPENLKCHRKLTRYDQRALRLSCEEAYMLTGLENLKTPKDEFVPVYGYRKDFVVRDISENLYLMSLTCKGLTAGKRVYDLGTDWRVFIRMYELEPNDEVFLYRVENYRSRGTPSIVITGSKSTDDRDDQELEECIDRVGENKLPGVMIGDGPVDKFAPRYLPDGVKPNEESSSYFRPQDRLLIHHVQEGDFPALALGYAEAYLLTRDETILQLPRFPYKMKFTGYDLHGVVYILEITNWIDEYGEIHYSVGDQWKNFMSTHHLKPGDEITFYQIQSCHPNDKFCAALRFFKRPKEKQ